MPRKPGAYYDKRAGCWASSSIGELRIKADGKAYRAKVFNHDLRHPTKDDLAAQAWVHDELKKQIEAMIPAGDISFEQLTQYYLEDAERDLSPEAYDRRVEHLNRFGAWPDKDDPRRMDLRPTRQISRADIEKFTDAMFAKGNSESYVSDGLIKSLRRLWNWAMNVEPNRFPGLPLQDSPLRKVKRPPIQRRASRNVDTMAVRRLIQWSWRRALKMGGLQQRFAKISTILMLCLRDTGARPKELCVAWWDEWQVQEDGWGVLTLPPWKHKTGRKTGMERTIAFPPHCTRRIEWIRSLEGRHAKHIFTHRRGRGRANAEGTTAEGGDPWVKVDTTRKRIGHTKTLQTWFFRLRGEAIEAGVPIDPKFRLYFNRSSYSTEAQRRGVSRSKLAVAMGTSERMLERNYTDMEKKDVLNIAKEVAQKQETPKT